MIAQNLYRLTNFYRLIVSTGLSPTPSPELLLFTKTNTIKKKGNFIK